MKKFLPCTNGQELQVYVRYSRDSRVRGYYLTVDPVTRNGYSTSYMLFSGEDKLLKQVTRKSAKAEKEAIELAAGYEQELIAKVLEKNELTLAAGGEIVYA